MDAAAGGGGWWQGRGEKRRYDGQERRLGKTGNNAIVTNSQ